MSHQLNYDFMQCNRNTNVWLVTNMYAAIILQAIKRIMTKWRYTDQYWITVN